MWRVDNPHYPLPSICKPSDDYESLRIQHYTGSMGSFLSRAGGNKEKWIRRNNLTAGTSFKDSLLLSSWIHDFVEIVGGVDNALELTENMIHAAENELKDL
eukprot:CAMPEP_0194231138 /NCGR_PEP_ID=MMETSP0156-20130528/44774_1 /TAXON_ID=33649 /ORGANISM="Thalassionema nitzschioides, Strain L26-B" /LENGTH=100 /DNA_ID=CAMNT_0038963753 /DNA_START=486 /DNA_END=785 /DNA_ORIENTATION=-